MTTTHDTVKNTLDAVAVFTTMGSFLEMLSPWFALVGAIVAIMRIAEMLTGKEISVMLGTKKKADDAVNE